MNMIFSSIEMNAIAANKRVFVKYLRCCFTIPAVYYFAGLSVRCSHDVRFGINGNVTCWHLYGCSVLHFENKKPEKQADRKNKRGGNDNGCIHFFCTTALIKDTVNT